MTEFERVFSQNNEDADFRTTEWDLQFAVVSNFFEAGDFFRKIKSAPTIFFVLSYPVLYDWIFCFKPVRG